ncbi:hypothetical protein M23134_00585 [Microscilla marina ATCC 23134]|uniref:Uncharacterized protein n=1 Tax=Microscilla marina ATCC 23134 TaxID=313606 RepID=A1ZY67_MICM2|nr:hypothetical protein M23134_00585 [Microscilla marina ATCC 23134]
MELCSFLFKYIVCVHTIAGLTKPFKYKKIKGVWSVLMSEKLPKTQ